ncbi:MAG: protein-export chaperone SecB [Clostridium sp.]
MGSKNTTSSMIRFLGYRIKQIDFKLNEEFFNNRKNEQLKMDLDFDFEKEEVDDKLKLIVKVIIFKNYTESERPFTLEVSIMGNFIFDKNVDTRTKEKLIYTNAIAILYPYLRMIVSNITSNIGITPVILPVINISKYWADKMNK